MQLVNNKTPDLGKKCFEQLFHSGKTHDKYCYTVNLFFTVYFMDSFEIKCSKIA